MNTIGMRGAFLFLLGLSAIGTLGAGAPAASAERAVAATGRTYATPEDAAAALVAALRAGRLYRIRLVLGPGSEKLISSGDKYADAAERQRFLAAYDERHELVSAAPDRMTLEVGRNNWPLPMPLVKANGRWHFDSRAGAQEIVDRRIGRNEIAAIRTALAYVDAQKAYFALTGQSGEAQYAQRLASSAGKHDGLYWPSKAGEPESPLAPLMAQATEAGYPGERVAGRPQPYYGYYFRILTGQGVDTPEGARSYVGNGRMTKGFALIAWPATYGVSGIMSLIVDEDGIVFQKDLGPRTAAVAAGIKAFDPDLSWAQVRVVN
jgi:hypothetical protein